MTLSLQQVHSSRFRTSAEADRLTVLMMSALGLSTKANVARLSIGRSLAVGAFVGEGPDAKGLEIPAASLFTADDIGVWVALIATHAAKFKLPAIDSMEAFRLAVRNHWHRGVELLHQDWTSSDANFDKFLDTLVVRRADLPDVAVQGSRQSKEQALETAKPEDLSGAVVKALSDIGVQAQIKGFVHGPRITRYRVLLGDINHLDKLRKGLERLGLLLNPQQGLPVMSHGNEPRMVNIDVPRARSSWKAIPFSEFRQWLATTPTHEDQLIVFPGVDVLGDPFKFDLATAPHLLVGGTTGSGKSVCLHLLILSLMLKLVPSELQIALIDPKQVEYSVYRDSNYLYQGTIATSTPDAKEMIQELVVEMESRYSQFSGAGTSNIFEARKKGLQLPSIVIFIEEMADLIMQDRSIEDHLVRLAQKARAAGIHLVLATQRPDAKTFSGLIRSNIPARIALAVQKSTESTIILDETGAENLLGAGDMLVKNNGKLDRVHGVMATRKDIEAVVKERGR